ncbi:protein lifeguard 1 [Ctenocephalides felis]|uniref:protein lifeguard 1 n=1 Tax=Ctenocephalides felis TaxID=7515 RepID=UPI000E6E29D5|nr:protein lifeguard 1 [Ctenocephalides felis]
MSIFSPKRSDNVDLITSEVSQDNSDAAVDADAQNNKKNSKDGKDPFFGKLPKEYVLSVDPRSGDIIGSIPLPDAPVRKRDDTSDVESGLEQPPPYSSPQIMAQYLFSEEKIRKNFLKKVYCILLTQLLITFGFVCLGVFEQNVKLFVQKNVIVLIVALVLCISMVIILGCVSELRRKSPWNYICLLTATASYSYLVMCIASIYEPHYVMMTVGLTILITVSLTLFAFQPWVDFTIMTGFLFIITLMFITFGILTLTLPHNIETLHTAYLCLGVLLFAFYIVYDTQLMIGGEHKYQISPEEYIFAALNLYLDIVYMFLYLLRLGRK